MTRALLLCLGGSTLLVAPSPAQAPDPLPARVDSIFASIDGTGSPGCAVGAVQNGRFRHRRGYGMADLERRVAITPQSVFYTGSVSKQFTAMSIALLARDGRLALDDPARKYLPELPEAFAAITVRHMVHHLSGLREKWELLQLQGFRDGNLVTQNDVLELVKRQRELNFAPGDDHLYNNTAYDLLATIVERVSGKPIRSFAAERIFGPLGMTRSQYVDDRTLLVPDRAMGYSAGAGQVTLNPAYVETVGSGSVYSTVEDLARWDESFYTAALGDQDLLRLVQTPGRLNDGTELSYAFGLFVDRWRGLRRVQHGGALAGFRAAIMRFPDERFSAIVLCNFAQANADGYAMRIAEVYLADRLAPAERRATTSTPGFGDAALARRAEGTYLSRRTGQVARIERRDSAVTLGYGPTRLPLMAAGPDRAQVIGLSGAEVVVFAGPNEGPIARLVVEGLGGRPEEFDRVDPPATSVSALAGLVGSYRSAELDVTWTVTLKEGALVARMARGNEVTLQPVFRDGFTAQGTVVAIDRDQRGRVRGLRVTPGRSRNIRFDRVEPPR
jgi:CubicO group peptidase (beta-lactamase class C family)